MALTRALAPGMKERRWGRIIHISSIMGLASTAGRNVYSATKAALVGLAKASALDLGAFNITVNCIAPGPFATEMPMSVLSTEQQAALAARTALNRWGQPEELAGPALLLASEAGFWLLNAYVADAPHPAIRVQAIQMVQVCHFLWPPFLFGVLYRKRHGAVRKAFDTFVRNLPFCEP